MTRHCCLLKQNLTYGNSNKLQHNNPSGDTLKLAHFCCLTTWWDGQIDREHLLRSAYPHKCAHIHPAGPQQGAWFYRTHCRCPVIGTHWQHMTRPHTLSHCKPVTLKLKGTQPISRTVGTVILWPAHIGTICCSAGIFLYDTQQFYMLNHYHFRKNMSNLQRFA